jgi:hypothetical protein
MSAGASLSGYTTAKSKPAEVLRVAGVAQGAGRISTVEAEVELASVMDVGGSVVARAMSVETFKAAVAEMGGTLTITATPTEHLTATSRGSYAVSGISKGGEVFTAVVENQVTGRVTSTSAMHETLLIMDTGLSIGGSNPTIAYTAKAQGQLFTALLGEATTRETFSAVSGFVSRWYASGRAMVVYALDAPVEASPYQLAMLFELDYPPWFAGPPIVPLLQSLQHGGVFRTRGVIQEAQSGPVASCASCFDSVIMQSPPPGSLLGIPIPSMPDQPIISLSDGMITATLYIASGSTTQVPPLDGNTMGAVLYEQSAALSAYLFQGTYYVCLCVNMPANAVQSPVPLILNGFPSFSLILAGN